MQDWCPTSDSSKDHSNTAKSRVAPRREGSPSRGHSSALLLATVSAGRGILTTVSDTQSVGCSTMLLNLKSLDTDADADARDMDERMSWRQSLTSVMVDV